MREASVAPVRSRCSSSSAAPTARQRLGVPALVIVGRGRQRHEDRGAADRGDLGQRRRPGAADDHVGRAHLLVHADRGRARPGQPGPARASPSRTTREIALAGLVRDVRRWRGPRQLRCCLDHGHVDRVRALGAAKDEHPPRPRWLGPDVQELGANRVPADEALLAEARRGLRRRSGRWRARHGPARRLVSPGCAFCSCSSTGTRRSQAATAIGPEL